MIELYCLRKLRGDLMKKIVANTLIVVGQLTVGALFLVGLFNSKAEDDMVAVVENNNLSKMADAVNVMFVSNMTDENVFLDDKKDEDENKEEEVLEELKQEDEVVEQEETLEEDPIYVQDTSGYQVLETYVGTLTGYGPDCNGCSGSTASGYNVSNTSTYTDSEFGEVRIVAAGSNIPLYSIVRISNIPNTEPIIAIVLDRGGNVGEGKMTLFDLLFRFYPVSEGKIYLDGRDIYDYSSNIYASNITMVKQNPFFYNMSIYQNLRLVNSSKKRQIAACKEVGIHDFIMSLKKNYSTVLRQNARNLSGGQKQLLAIARALLTDAEILLMDDITASLDPKTTIHIVSLLKRLKEDHTILVITNREDLIRAADQIIYLKDGVASCYKNMADWKKQVDYEESDIL